MQVQSLQREVDRLQASLARTRAEAAADCKELKAVKVCKIFGSLVASSDGFPALLCARWIELFAGCCSALQGNLRTAQGKVERDESWQAKHLSFDPSLLDTVGLFQVVRVSRQMLVSDGKFNSFALMLLGRGQAERDLALQTLTEVKKAVASSEAARSATLHQLQDAIQREKSSLEVCSSRPWKLLLCPPHESTTATLQNLSSRLQPQQASAHTVGLHK